MVRRADGVLVVLHDDDGVAQVAQLLQGGQQALVVALVQPDGRLIEDVEHPHQPRADLRRQANALRLATRQRLRRATHGEVVEPDIVQEAQPLAHLLEDGRGNFGVESGTPVLAQRDLVEEAARLADRHFDELADVARVHGDGERLGLEAAPAARRAGAHHHVAVQLRANGVGVGFLVAALDVGEDALPRDGGRGAGDGRPFRGGFGGGALLLAVSCIGIVPGGRRGGAAQEGALHLLGKPGPWSGQVEAEGLGQAREDHAAQVAVGFAPREDDSFQHGERRITEDEVFADLATRPQSAARGAGPEGRVEREVARFQLRHGDAAVGTAVALREEVPRLVAGVPHDLDQPFRQLEGGLDRVVEPAAIVGTHHQPVDDDGDVVVLPLVQLGR